MTDPIDIDALSRRAAQFVPKKEVPRSFVAFCSFVNVTLTPGQRVLCSIAYDGLEPNALEGEDRELARKIFGDIETIPTNARSVLAAVCGGRAGKSFVLIALRMVWGMYVRDLRSLAPGQRAVSWCVAPNATLRQEIVNYATGIIRANEYLKSTLVLPKGTKDEDALTGFVVKRADGRMVAFEAGVATRGGYSGRGRSLVDAALDECCFFRDASYAVNDDQLFKAASPRVLPGGQTLVCSTPWGESGLLYEMWSKNFGKPTTAMVAHAPTLLLHDSPMTREIVERERIRDVDNCAREFEANFMGGGTTNFFDLATIEAAIDPLLNVDPVAT